jgi:hypothetical protein
MSINIRLRRSVIIGLIIVGLSLSAWLSVASGTILGKDGSPVFLSIQSGLDLRGIIV